MLYAFGFERVGVVVSDLYFVDPHPSEGQEGPERGVRLEVRMLQRGELKGSIYSAQPIAVEDPIWRVDLLESVAGLPGALTGPPSPRFAGWEPGRRATSRICPPILSAGWGTGWPISTAFGRRRPGFGRRRRRRGQAAGGGAEILDAVQRLLNRVRAADRGGLPPVDETVGARVGWL